MAVAACPFPCIGNRELSSVTVSGIVDVVPVVGADSIGKSLGSSAGDRGTVRSISCAFGCVFRNDSSDVEENVGIDCDSDDEEVDVCGGCSGGVVVCSEDDVCMGSIDVGLSDGPLFGLDVVNVVVAVFDGLNGLVLFRLLFIAFNKYMSCLMQLTLISMS